MSLEKFDELLNVIDPRALHETDVGRSELEDIVNDFSENSWIMLYTMWQSRPESWQSNCLGIMDGVESEYAKSLMFEMLKSEYNGVMLVALNWLSDSDNDDCVPNPEQIEILKQLFSVVPFDTECEIREILDRAKNL